MNEIQWAPGFIQLTSGRGLKYWQCVAEIVQFNSGTRADGTHGSYITLRGTHGSYVTLRGEDEGDRFTIETPEQIGDLIRDNWEKRISGEAAMGAEYGTGGYKIGKDGWK